MVTPYYVGTPPGVNSLTFEVDTGLGPWTNSVALLTDLHGRTVAHLTNWISQTTTIKGLWQGMAADSAFMKQNLVMQWYITLISQLSEHIGKRQGVIDQFVESMGAMIPSGVCWENRSECGGYYGALCPSWGGTGGGIGYTDGLYYGLYWELNAGQAGTYDTVTLTLLEYEPTQPPQMVDDAAMSAGMMVGQMAFSLGMMAAGIAADMGMNILNQIMQGVQQAMQGAEQAGQMAGSLASSSAASSPTSGHQDDFFKDFEAHHQARMASFNSLGGYSGPNEGYHNVPMINAKTMSSPAGNHQVGATDKTAIRGSSGGSLGGGVGKTAATNRKAIKARSKIVFSGVKNEKPIGLENDSLFGKQQGYIAKQRRKELAKKKEVTDQQI